MSAMRSVAVLSPSRCRDCSDCRAACPLGQDVPGYICAIQRGAVADASRRIAETAALPGVLGRLCPAPCVSACRMPTIGRPAPDIRGLKRFAVGQCRALPETPEGQALHFAVVGAGPSGLAAAHALRRAGVQVTVFDAADGAGGLLASAVPEFVLPQAVLRDDVAQLAAAGIAFQFGVRVGGDAMPWSSLSRRFDGVVQATGRSASHGAANATGSNAVYTPLQWAARFHRNEALPGAQVLVLGGDVRALACARMAIRLGAAQVTLADPLPRSHWSMGSPGQSVAQREGIALLDLHAAEGLGETGAPETSEMNGNGDMENAAPGWWLRQQRIRAIDWIGMPQLRDTGARQWVPADFCIKKDSTGGINDDTNFAPTPALSDAVLAGEAAGLPLNVLAAMAQGRGVAHRLLAAYGVSLRGPA
ncbi:MAG: NAD(P)-binding protein [Myxococcales bacterium]|nr:NAD(P)-binding protein [Myxococcales bacterium]